MPGRRGGGRAASTQSVSARRWTWPLVACTVTACARFGYDQLPIADADAAPPGGTWTDGVVGLGGKLTGAAGSDGDSGASASAAGSAGGSVDGPADGGADSATLDGGGRAVLPDVGCDAACACSFAAPERLGNPNYPGNRLGSPSLSSDGLSLYVAVIVPGLPEMIGLSTRPDRGDTFSLANALPAPVYQSTEGTPRIAADGLSLYFYSTRPGGAGDSDLYVARRPNTGTDFNSVSALSALNSSAREHLPWVSSDELVVYFASDRAGSMDLWTATRSARAQPFSAPTPVAELNSSADDAGLSLSADELVVILASARAGGAGGWDLYRAVRTSRSAPFSAPAPIAALDTAAGEWDPELSRDGRELFFVSDRNAGASELWRSVWTCP